jgi:hypothetical protein
VTRLGSMTLLVIAVVAALTGCILLPLPVSSPIAEQPDPTVADHVAIDTDGILVIVADGSDVAFDYFESDPVDVVAALEDGFGFAPSAIPLPAGGTRYGWGGFELTAHETAGDYPVAPRFTVRVTSDHAGDVALLLGGSGIVGGPVGEISSEAVVLSEHPLSHEVVAEWHRVAVDPAAVEITAPGTEPALVTLVSWNGQFDTITQFSAPVPSW